MDIEKRAELKMSVAGKDSLLLLQEKIACCAFRLGLLVP